MPASRVEIEASFAKIETEPKLPFADVSSGDWYYDAVVYVYKNGLMDGTGPAAFAPTTVLTRSMATQVLWNLGGQPCRPRYGRLHRRAVGRVVRRCGQLVGVPGDCDRVQHRGLGPEDAVTREQLAAMLYRYAGTPEPTGSLDGFNDKDAVSDYAADALCWAGGRGSADRARRRVGSSPAGTPPVPRWPPFSCALQNPTTKHRSPPDQGLILLGTQCDLWTTQPVRVNKKDSKS